MAQKNKISVLFVCLGNICRSPTAHGVFRDLVRKHDLGAQIEVDSAGTHAYHVGNAPDPRSIDTAMTRGVNIKDLRAMKVVPQHFHDFDYVLAMDRENLSILEALKPANSKALVGLMLDYGKGGEVPDPYYGGPDGFIDVYDMVEEACQGLLKDIAAKLDD